MSVSSYGISSNFFSTENKFKVLLAKVSFLLMVLKLNPDKKWENFEKNFWQNLGKKGGKRLFYEKKIFQNISGLHYHIDDRARDVITLR